MNLFMHIFWKGYSLKWHKIELLSNCEGLGFHYTMEAGFGEYFSFQESFHI